MDFFLYFYRCFVSSKFIISYLQCSSLRANQLYCCWLTYICIIVGRNETFGRNLLAWLPWSSSDDESPEDSEVREDDEFDKRKNKNLSSYALTYWKEVFGPSFSVFSSMTVLLSISSAAVNGLMVDKSASQPISYPSESA